MKKLLYSCVVFMSAIAASCQPVAAAQPRAPWCQYLGNIAGFAADAGRTHKEKEVRELFEGILQSNELTPEQIAKAREAFRFGWAMRSKATPQEIAKYQYYGCLATT